MQEKFHAGITFLTRSDEIRVQLPAITAEVILFDLLQTLAGIALSSKSLVPPSGSIQTQKLWTTSNLTQRYSVHCHSDKQCSFRVVKINKQIIYNMTFFSMGCLLHRLQTETEAVENILNQCAHAEDSPSYYLYYLYYHQWQKSPF
jgi:hypothetical protein